MDEELRKLCEEVYAKTGWIIVRNGGVGYDYTSDYILEELPAQRPEGCYLMMEKMEADDYEFGYAEWGQFSHETGRSDTPLKALLKLTIALHEAGELSSKEKER